MIRVTVFHADGSLELGGQELLDRSLPEGSQTWIDVQGHTADNEAFIAAMGFHPLAVEDTFTLQHQPKVEEYEELLFTIVRGIDFNRKSARLETLKLAAFLTRDRLVTFHRAPMRSVAGVLAALEEGKKVPRGGVVHLLYLLWDAVVDLYFPLVEEIGADVERIEEEIFDSPTQEHLETILVLRKRLRAIRRVMLPHRVVFNHLASGTCELVEEHEAIYFRDVFDNVFRLADAVDQQRDQLSGVRDSYLSMVSQRTNEVMRTLTVISAVILPLTFLAGLYGMNFEHMPELHFRYSYPVLLGFMALVAVGLISWFKRKGWL